MKFHAILKKIVIKNNDTDTYASILLDIDITNIDINTLYKYSHKSIILSIKEE